MQQCIRRRVFTVYKVMISFGWLTCWFEFGLIKQTDFRQTVKLGYNEQLGTVHFCSLLPGFVITGFICVLKVPISPKNMFVITGCSLTTESVKPSLSVLKFIQRHSPRKKKNIYNLLLKYSEFCLINLCLSPLQYLLLIDCMLFTRSVMLL
jgi:hypothetical protein